MADGRSSKSARAGSKRAGSKRAGIKAGATSVFRKRKAAATRRMQRTVVLDGIFSIEELEVTAASGRKTAKATKKKAMPKKRAREKVASGAKRVVKPQKEKSVARKNKPVAKSATSKKSVIAGSDPVVLDNRPSIKNIAELKDQLTVAHNAEAAVVVDAGNVDSIDTAALQLLLAFANSVRKQSRTVEWRQPSSAFCAMADLADLSQCLGVGDKPVAEEDDGLCPVF